MPSEQETYLMLVEFTFRDNKQAMKIVREEMRKVRELAMQKSTKGKLRIWKVTRV